MTTATSAGSDVWSSVTEQSIFLGDGLKFVVDALLQSPISAQHSTVVEYISEHKFENVSKAELGQTLLNSCALQHGSFYKFFEYRQRALLGLWQSQRSEIKKLPGRKSKFLFPSEERHWKAAVDKTKRQVQRPEVSFSSHVSLLLLLPILQSQSKKDPSLAGQSTELLLQCLKNCSPNSLSVEPSSCITGLANLLCSWLRDTEDARETCKQEETSAITVKKESLIAALITLACGRLSIQLFVQVLQVLQRRKDDLEKLHVGEALRGALEYERMGTFCDPSILQTSRFVTSWQLAIELDASEQTDSCRGDQICNLTCDGKFLYLNNCAGKGLLKVGTGKHKTLRGIVYGSNPNLGEGWLVSVQPFLMFRPKEFDNEPTKICYILDPLTLQKTKTVELKTLELSKGESEQPTLLKTVQFLSDGIHVYWIWYTKSSSPPQDSSTSYPAKTQVDIHLQEFSLEMVSGEFRVVAIPCNNAVLLKKEEPVTLLTSPLPVRRSPTAATAQKEPEEMTSCGVLLNNLLQSAMFINGDMLVMVVPLLSSPGASTLLSLRGHKSPLNYCFSTLDGSCVKQEHVVNSAMPNWQDLLAAPFSICHDPANHCLWVYGNSFISEWLSGGYPSNSQICQKLGTAQTIYTEGCSNDLDSEEAMSLLAHHITFLCKALDSELEVLSFENGEVKLNGSLDSQHINRICDVLQTAVSNGQHNITMSMLIALQTLMNLVAMGQAELDNDGIEGAKRLLWELVSLKSDSVNFEVVREACRVLSDGFDVFYPSAKDKSAVIMYLLSEGDGSPGMAYLSILLFTDMADITMACITRESTIMERLEDDAVYLALKICVKESCDILLQCGSMDDQLFSIVVITHPELSPVLQFITAVFTSTWREIVLHDEVCNDLAKQSECETLCLKVLDGCQQVLDVCTEVLNKLSTEFKGDLKERLEGLEHIFKATLPGQTLPLLASVLSSDRCCRLTVAKNLLPAVTNITVTTTRVAYFLSEMKFRGDVADGGKHFLSVPIPSPWSNPRHVETPHPVRDDYHCCKTLVLPGAQCLYLRFDPRCATQYEYDKVIVYAGKTVSGRKIAEFGGNSHGAGGRGVIRLGWPKEAVKVEGDAVTLSFHVKSARERNTPDRAVWGFRCVVSAKEQADKEARLPFLTDMCLSLCVLTHSLLNIMYQGPAHSEAEEACQHLLDSKLLQRCVWSNSASPSNNCGITITVSTEIETSGTPASTVDQLVAKTSSRLTSEVLSSLRSLSGTPAPTIRPSLRQALQLDVVEEVLVRCVVKHMGLSSMVDRLPLVQAADTESAEYIYMLDVMREVFSRVNGLIRQLQTMAEMEQKWAQGLDDVRQELVQPSAAFFNDFHLQEAKSKELELLCTLKNVEFDPMEQEQAVGKLIERLENEAKVETESREKGNVLSLMPVTKKFLYSIMECAQLLCNVTIESSKTKPTPERSVSHSCFAEESPQRHQAAPNIELRTPPTPTFLRSLSAPSKLDRSLSVQEGVHDVRRLQQWRNNVQKKHSHVSPGNAATQSEVDKTFLSTVAQIFSFVGSDPDKAVTCSSFLAAARVRNERGLDRVQALQCMTELVTVCSRVDTPLPHLLSAVTSILAQGPRTEELKCGGMVTEVRDMFSAVIQAVMQQASFDPTVYRDSILVLSTCPFAWHEERCVMRSGLVYLLDKLCSMKNEKTDAAINLSAMAWAGFQVLLDRIVQWENDKDFRAGAIEYSGLAHQVSSLLSNYLSCVLDESRKNGATSRDALQFVMELLHNISRSKLGEGILREPRTISTLLSLLLDRRAPPKLVLIVLKLCRYALPLMNAKSCEEVTLPPAARQYLVSKQGIRVVQSPVVRVAALLLAKLGDFVLPSVDPRSEDELNEWGVEGSDGSDAISGEHNSGMVCLYLHKRDDQPAHEVVQKVLSTSGTSFIFRVGQGSEMERAVQLDRELTQHGRGILQTDSLDACLNKASYWAQKGLVVSVGPYSWLDEGGVRRGSTHRQSDPESVCKARNSRLSRSECSRPFICGQVADSMASEVITLLHGLLTSPATETAKIWASSVRDVLSEALDCVPELIQTLETEGRIWQSEDSQTEGESDEGDQLFMEHTWFFKARNVVAALCALGGFRQSVHSGCTVQVCGEDLVHATGEVVSVSERQGMATVLLDNGEITYSKSVEEIPLARLRVANTQVVFLSEFSIVDQAVSALLAILSAKEALISKSPAEECEKPMRLSPAARILAEIKTRASTVLSCQVQDSDFCETLRTHPLHMRVSTLAVDCDPGQRLPVLEIHCQQLRKLFKDFVKPNDTSNTKSPAQKKKLVLDTERSFPPVRGCVFTEGYTCVHFMADPAAGSGLPRGTFVYSTAPVPQKAPSFYWEVELCSLGDSTDQETGPSISIGLAPATGELVSGWINPVGSCLLHSNGRAIHCRSGGLLTWKTVSLNVTMKENDVIGCGYKRTDEQHDRGLVYFTYNGNRLAENLEGAQAGLWPVVHIQKKNVRVRVNFGARDFLYSEGLKQRVAADIWSDSLEELRQGFGELPFAFESEQDAVDGTCVSKLRKTSPQKLAPVRIPRLPGQEYDPLLSLHYKLTSSYDNMTDVGLAAPLRAVEEGSSQGGEVRPVDPSRLLVKAWEDKVFPLIRRRFRSNTDRNSGLEQIRGALLAGMIDIAISTVADLYEDNGGIPSTLQFPKLEDVKADANKLSAGSLKPGQAVVINSSGMSLPGFAVPDMKKTFGLTGVVKGVDKPQGLAEIETYNREEGTLMRYWYPVSCLERPTAVLARSSSLALCSEESTRTGIYCELLRNEACLTRLFCREAHAKLLKSTNKMADKVELLRTLATQLLTNPQTDGTVAMTSPQSSPDPRHCLVSNSLLPSTLFFSEPARLVSEIRELLSLLAEQDKEGVLGMVSTLCEVLKKDTNTGHYREVSISAGKQDEHVTFPGAAVTVVSCREDPGCLTSGGGSGFRTPSVSILCYYGSQKLNKNGNLAQYKVVQYPNMADSNTATGGIPNLYPVVILPCNQVHVRCQASATEGLIVDLNAFPGDFFLALVFIEVFTSSLLEDPWQASHASDSAASAEKRAALNRTIFFELADVLSSFLLKHNLPAFIKEIIFQLLAQLLRACYQVERWLNEASAPEHMGSLFLVISRLSLLRVEMQKLLEKELSANNTAALDFILNCNFEHSKFSSYLQALLGLVSAAAEISQAQKVKERDSWGKLETKVSFTELHNALQEVASSDVTDSGVRSAPPVSMEGVFNFDVDAVIPSTATEANTFSGPPSPKCKARDRRGSVRRRKRGFGHGVTSPTESMPWFDKIVSCTLLLRNLIHGDQRGSAQVAESLAAVVTTKSSSLRRLLIVTNIATTVCKKTALDAIKKACKPSGGIHDTVAYLPEVPQAAPAEDRSPTNQTNEEAFRVKSLTELLPSAQRDKPARILGYAVVELKSASQVDLARQAITSCKALKDDNLLPDGVGVAKVNSELLVEGTNELAAFAVFEKFLNLKLFNGKATEALHEIFSSCVRCVAQFDTDEVKTVGTTGNVPGAAQSKESLMQPAGLATEVTLSHDTVKQPHESDSTTKPEVGPQSKEMFNRVHAGDRKSDQLLTKGQMCTVVPGNQLLCFFNGVRHAKESASELVTQLLTDYGVPIEGSEERGLRLSGFVAWVLDRGLLDVRAIWKGIIACGYDLQLNRCTHIFPSEMEADHAEWTAAKDHALVLYVDALCRALSTTPSRLMPDELQLSEVDLTAEEFHTLQGLSLRSLRSRFAFLKSLNSDVERLLLPLTDLRAADGFSLSTGSLLRDARGLLFYHTKVALLNQVLDHTAHRGLDHPSPEVSLDPLETLEADKVSLAGPQFCQTARHLSALSSVGLRVKVATGGDPVFPLKVHLRGEQVLGSGGSFRHFMWLMARELQGPHVGLLIPCPSAAANKNKGQFILSPGPVTYSEEKLLIFFGQLLGIALRSDIPLALDLLPCFWKSLLNLALDDQEDLREADILTYNYLRRFSEVESREEFQTLCFEADLCPYRFVYTSLDGVEVELCQDGANIGVTWENHRSYVQAIRDLRMKELRCESRMAAVRCGLSSVVPLHVLTVMTPYDMEIRTCGLPILDLGFLKAHTAYVAGTKETDVHVEYFWNSMESFTQDQLRKFVKFACNQERLPSRCTCQDGNPNTADVHVPPYPMKIGPPDGRGPSDARYIRVETCMFMVKLPQYSSQEKMTEKVLYAINCREDPLTDIT